MYVALVVAPQHGAYDGQQGVDGAGEAVVDGVDDTDTTVVGLQDQPAETVWEKDKCRETKVIERCVRGDSYVAGGGHSGAAVVNGADLFASACCCCSRSMC